MAIKNYIQTTFIIDIVALIPFELISDRAIFKYARVICLVRLIKLTYKPRNKRIAESFKNDKCMYKTMKFWGMVVWVITLGTAVFVMLKVVHDAHLELESMGHK